MLDDVLNMLDDAESTLNTAATTAKRARANVKPPETLDDAEQRILGMKLRDAEIQIVRDVFTAIRDGHVGRPPHKKLAKKHVLELWEVVREQKRAQLRQQVLDNHPDNFIIVQTESQLRQLGTYLQQEPLTAWDSETTGLDLYNDKIVGYSCYLPNLDMAYYVPFGHTTGQQQVNEVYALSVAKAYLQNPANKTIWHNYKYDGHMFLNHGIRVANPYWDTQVCAKLLYEHGSHRLKDLYATWVLGEPDSAVMFEDLFDDHVIYDKDVVLSGIYAAGDAHKTFKLYQFQRPHIDTVGNLKTVWYNIEQKLLQVDLDMERTGFRIDLERIQQLLTEYRPQLQTAEAAIRAAFNLDDADFLQRMADHMGKPVEQVAPFNIQSNPHLGYLLYDVLGCDPNIGKRFKKGERSTASEVIDALCEQHEQLKPMLTYRKLFKIVSTYLEKIPLAMEPATGRLHAKFNNMGDEGSESGTATGRYSSSEYCSAKNSRTGDTAKGTNFQNIPSRSTQGVEVRKCFIPDDRCLFVSSDLSQINNCLPVR